MKFSIQQFEINMKEIECLVEHELFEEAYKKYAELDNNITMNEHTNSEVKLYGIEIIANFYSSYAYFLFSMSEYNLFFKMYIKAQNYGYSSEKRKKFIYEAFISPNLNEFKLNYEKNITRMLREGCIKKALEFEELPFWLITTDNQNEYYLYEKDSDLIKENFIIDLETKNSSDEDMDINLCDNLIISNACWMEVQSQIKVICSQGRKCFLVVNNIEKLLSHFQGGIINELYLTKIILFEDFSEFKDYFIKSDKYLPRQFIGPDEKKAKYEKTLEEIHKYRLKKENRLGNNILISVCIPSFNRGKRAYDNIIHLLQSYYDEEIEIVLSNNGTKNESKEFYKKIDSIKDSRLTYFEFDENQGFSVNLCKTIELAKGKYVLLLSDEDLVDLNKFQSILNILNSEDIKLAIVRTKTDGQGLIPFVGMAEPGKDSLLKFMLTSNYMSGMILNKELIEKYNLLEYIRKNLDNQACLYYPHMVFELLLSQYGSVLGQDIVLINEGHVEKTDVIQSEIGINDQKHIPYYETLESRLGQQKGFFDVINELEISKNNFDILRELYKKLCLKTFFLVCLSIKTFYKETDISTHELLEITYDDSIEHLKEIYKGKKNRNKYKYSDDLAEIKQYYNYFKNYNR